MKKIAHFFIENYKFTFVLSAMVVIFGLFGLMRINAESYPSVDFAMATITTNYDGASAEDIETRITKPIEDEVRSVTGIKDVRSVSQPGISTILVRADIDNVDVEKLMADLQRSVDRVTDLPPDLKDRPRFVEVKSEEFPVMELAIVGDNSNRARDLVADMLKEDIEDNKSVLNARLVGYQERAFQIQLDSRRMKALHIGIDEVLNKIETRNRNIPGGTLKSSGEQRLVRIEGKIRNKNELDNILIRSNFSGKTVYLKDIATIVDDQQEATIHARHNGEEATLLIVRKKGGADTISMVNDINSRLDKFRSLYGEKFKFKIYNNEALRVKNKLGVLSSNAVSGLVLVVFFLLLFLPGRIGLMASLSLPLAVMATLGFIPSMDMNLNAITILALVIALGMLVDNSVVISENFARLRQEGLSAHDAAMVSVRQLWLPITATVMTTIAAFLPMLVTTGIMGQFIKYIPIIVSLSLVISLAESFFFLPMRLVRIESSAKANNSHGKTGWFDKVASKFESFMNQTIRHRYIALFVFTGLMVGSVVMMTVFNRMVLFPSDETEIYLGRLELTHGSTLEDTNEEIKIISEKIHQINGEHIADIVARAGTSSMGPTDPKGKSGNNTGIIFMYATDHAKSNVKETDFLEKIRVITGSERVKSLTFEAMVNGPPVGDPVNATFRSNNAESLHEVITGVMSHLSETEGIMDVKVDDVIADQQVYIDINYQKADRLGLNVNSVGNSIRSALAGKVISNVNLNNKEVDLVVRFKEEMRKNVADLKTIQVMDKRGYLIPITDFATIRQEGGKPYIKRFDFKRAKTVTANIDTNKMTAIEANLLVQKKFDELVKTYKDVSIVFGGEGESTNESMASLFNALILSLIGIFALLVFLFNSFVRPLIIMTTIPLGLVGFSIAFALHGRPISFLALIGIIGLGGIIVNSGIILISFIEDMKAEGRPLLEVLVTASRIRLRAVLVSSLTTISGLIPTAYGIGGSDALLVPMTLAMAWGLTSGTILTLVWVPCAYAILEDVNGFIGKIFSRKSKDDHENPQQNHGTDMSKVS